MALAQPAYRLDTYPDFSYEAPARPDLRAHRSPETSSSTKLLVTAAKMAAVVLVVVAALAFARIALTNATVVTMIETDSISSQITQARSSGVSLEMEQSVLSNSSAISAAAKRLGMAAPEEVGMIALTPDIVATEGNGDLSLSKTVGNLVQAQG